MADPSYIDAAGILTDGEAWIPIGPTSPAANPLTSDASVITFTSPNDGSSTDWSQFLNLILIGTARSDRSSGSWDNINISLNQDTTDANYRRKYGYGDGSSVAYSGSGLRIAAHTTCETGDDLIFSAHVWHLLDVNSGKYKSMLFHNSAEYYSTGGIIEMEGLTWTKNESIERIDLTVKYGSNFKEHTRWDLFGELPRMVS